MKTVQKILCALLVVAMLLPCVILPIDAAGTGSIENLYDVKNATFGTAPEYSYNECAASNMFCSSKVISVREGNTITVGPILEGEDWFIRTYNDNGEAIKKVTRHDCVEEAALRDNANIYTYTVPAGIKYVCVTTSYMFYDCTLVTKNRTFTAEEYLAYMEKQGINVDFLKPTAADAADATNLFNKNDGKETLLYPYKTEDGTLNTDAVDRDRSREWSVGVGEGKLKEGDVIYAVALRYEERSTPLFSIWFNESYRYITSNSALLCEDLGRGFGIYVVRVPKGATKVAVTLGAGNYDDGISLMTVNQPFTGESYRKLFNIDLEKDLCDESSPLNGLKGLFVGDSISNGSHDAKSYLDDPENWRGWAGGIAAATGMISTNASVSGAKIRYDTKWIWNQQNAHKNEEFDVVVMQGGVNDAGSNETKLGKIIENVELSSAELEQYKDTYLGGLQHLFATVRENWPNATFFFIANYKLSGNKATAGQRENLGEWFLKAEELCELYGVHFIDLYNNEELKTALDIDSDSRIYIHDGTHPNKAGYDIITPYVQAEMERVMAEIQASDETTGEKTESGSTVDPDDATTKPDGGTTADPNAGTDPGSTPSEDKKGCGSVVTTSLLFAAIALLIPAAVTLRKKESVGE